MNFRMETRMMVKELREALHFMCSVEFWRMGVLWTLSLVVSYLQLFFRSVFARNSPSYTRCIPETSPIKPVCIITGATSGLGAATACALSKEGFCIVLAGRSTHLLSKAVEEIKKSNKKAHLKAFQVDISSFQSILKFKGSLQQWLSDSNMHSSVQLLINNAGILATSSRLTAEGYDHLLDESSHVISALPRLSNLQSIWCYQPNYASVNSLGVGFYAIEIPKFQPMMGTNYIGPFALTQLLLPLLRSSPIPSRVVNVTSFTHRSVFNIQIDKETISGECFLRSRQYPYAHIYEYSKLCLLLFSYELHRQLRLMDKSSQVSVIAADPGAVETNIMREVPACLSRVACTVLKLLWLLQSPESGASSIIDAALAPPEVTGVYFFGGKGRILDSSSLSCNTELAKELRIASHDLFSELQLASDETSTS